MNALPTGPNTHLRIEKALAEGRRQGAVKAIVTLDQLSNQVTLQDDRPAPEPHTETFGVDLSSARHYIFPLMDHIRSHILPEGLNVTLTSNFKRSGEYSENLVNLRENIIARQATPDGRYVVSVAQSRRHSIAVAAQDGTSAAVPFYQTLHTLNRTEDQEPGAPVKATRLSIIADAQQPDQDATIPPAHLADVTATAAKLIADHIENTAASGGYVWPNSDLRAFISLNDPHGRTMPEPPSVSEYQMPGEQGQSKLSYGLTPRNAVFCDYDSVQSTMLLRAVKEHAPRDVTPVNTQDTSVSTMRLLHADVENLDGSTTRYTALPWDMQTRSGRYDNQPVPAGERLPHNRVERVSKIQLTMEIHHSPTADSDIFTFDTDVYADQDRHHHLLLVTQDSTVSRETLEHIAYLHSPRSDDPNSASQIEQALDQSPDEWYNRFLIDNVHQGPLQAARNALLAVATTVEAMDLNNDQTGTQRTVEEQSPSGKVRITLNPGREQGFQMPNPPVAFVSGDPSAFVNNWALIIATTENPGGIQPGHALRYSSYDRKLETFQPEGTHFSRRVHPLTVRPMESDALDIVRAQPDTTWLVVARGSDHLVLAPMRKDTAE